MEGIDLPQENLPEEEEEVEFGEINDNKIKLVEVENLIPEEDCAEDESSNTKTKIRLFCKKYSCLIYTGITVVILLYFLGMCCVGIIITFSVVGESGGEENPVIPIPNPSESSSSFFRVLSINETSGVVFNGILQLSEKEKETSLPNFPFLSFKIFPYYDIVRIRIIPVDENFQEIKRWEVPVPLDLPPLVDSIEELSYETKVEDAPFSVKIINKNTNNIIFDIYDFQFSDQYLSLKIRYDSDNEKLFGFSTRDFYLNPKSETKDPKCYYLWNKDEYLRYNSHPFTLTINSETKEQKGFLFFTSNLIEMCHSSSKNQIQYNSIGGIFDLFFIAFSDPIYSFQRLLGPKHKSVPPLWSLGFHQSRWGYNDISSLRSVVDEYETNGIPLDAIWSDIDYMDGFMDFTFDPISFPIDEMKNFSTYLHDQKKKKYVVIIDPGIKTLDLYYPYHLGKQKDIFVKRNRNNDPVDLIDDDVFQKYVVGIVWPGYTVFPDFSNPIIKDEYWKPLLKSFLLDLGVTIDGLWIDMNEIANFCHGRCSEEEEDKEEEKSGQSLSSLNFPPYLPSQMIRDGHFIWTKTIEMDSVQNQGLTFDLHNLYGYQESVVTQQSFEEVKNVRSFILTRSTFLGSGNVVSNWLGDNYATFDDLYTSILGIFSQNMFGVLHVGADICGFHGSSTTELCVRWFELGSFYPFSRQHSNMYDSNLKEVYRLSPFYQEKVKSLLLVRYSLLPYIYSLFHKFREEGAGMIWSPLFVHFPETILLSDDREFMSQIMFGSCLMLAPVTKEGVIERTVYFPDSSTFYDFFTNEKVEIPNDGNYLTVSSPLGTIPLYVKDKCVLAMQTPSVSTEVQKSNPYQLIVSLASVDLDNMSIGELYIDEGDEVIPEVNYTSVTHFQFEYDQMAKELRGNMVLDGYGKSYEHVLDSIKFLGFRGGTPQKIMINHVMEHGISSYDQVKHELVLENLGIVFNESFVVELGD